MAIVAAAAFGSVAGDEVGVMLQRHRCARGRMVRSGLGSPMVQRDRQVPKRRAGAPLAHDYDNDPAFAGKEW